MKNPMDDSHPLRSESGFALIEVIVAAAVLAIVALAVLSGIDAASGASAREKARAVAASLAERDQERLRSMTYEEIVKVHPDRPATQQADTVIDGVTYKIKSVSEAVTDNVGGTPECGEEGTQVTYVHITSTVTSNVVGRNIKPVVVDSLVPPTQKWAEGHGTLGVKVVDRTATQGVRNLAVSATSTAFTPPTAATDANGCVVFKDVPVGSYTITVGSPGYIDRDGNGVATSTANVVAKKVVFATLSYDVADTINVEVRTHRPGTTWTAAGPTQQQPSQARKVSILNGANVGKLWTVTPPSPASTMPATNLFPFAENSYAFFTGGCTYQSPDKVTLPTGTVTTPRWPNYFNTTGGVNPAGAVLADPAVNPQTAHVRQPPINIRINRDRGRNETYSDSSFTAWAVPQKPVGFATDTCVDPPIRLYLTTWNSAAGFGTPPSPGTHYMSTRSGSFDPGLPFGYYDICLRNGTQSAVVVSDYDNSSPDGGTARSINADALSWGSGGCNY
jgi:prepilin-type N-terminal cleavage/methylation domain-containing protein